MDLQDWLSTSLAYCIRQLLKPNPNPYHPDEPPDPNPHPHLILTSTFKPLVSPKTGLSNYDDELKFPHIPMMF